MDGWREGAWPSVLVASGGPGPISLLKMEGEHSGKIYKSGLCALGPIPPKNIRRRVRKMCCGLIDWAHST